MTLITDVFPKLLVPKNVVKKISTKSPLSGTKHCWNLNHTIFTIFIDTVKTIELEKISLSDMQILNNAY